MSIGLEIIFHFSFLAPDASLKTNIFNAFLLKKFKCYLYGLMLWSQSRDGGGSQ